MTRKGRPVGKKSFGGTVPPPSLFAGSGKAGGHLAADQILAAANGPDAVQAAEITGSSPSIHSHFNEST
jgi:hypothetical protein